MTDSAALGPFARACLGMTLSDSEWATLSTAPLLALAERHRVSAVAYGYLAALAGEAGAELNAEATRKRLVALRQGRLTVKLSAALTAAGVEHLVIKGAPLAQSLYGDIAARDSKDIDVLVAPAQWAAARNVIEQAGYAPHRDTPATAPSALATKDASFIDHKVGVEVELHHRLFDVPALLPRSFAQLWADRAGVAIAGVEVPILSPLDTFLYLCGHGAESAWFRLKWLQDIARILQRTPSAEMEQYIATARTLGFHRVVTSTLILTGQIYGLGESDRAADRSTERIVERARLALEAPEAAAHDRSLRQLLIDATDKARFRRDWRYRGAIVRGIFITPSDVAALPLPSWALWLHVPLRPVMLVRRRIARKRGGHNLGR